MTIDALEVARRVAGCGDVARLTGGPGGVGTPVVGDRWVEGVRDLDPGIEVHVVASWDFTAQRLTDQIHECIGSLGSPIEVIIDDIATPYDELAAEEAPGAPASAADGRSGPAGDNRSGRTDGRTAEVDDLERNGEIDVVLVPVAVSETVIVVDDGGEPTAPPLPE